MGPESAYVRHESGSPAASSRSTTRVISQGFANFDNTVRIPIRGRLVAYGGIVGDLVRMQSVIDTSWRVTFHWASRLWDFGNRWMLRE